MRNNTTLMTIFDDIYCNTHKIVNEHVFDSSHNLWIVLIVKMAMNIKKHIHHNFSNDYKS